MNVFGEFIVYVWLTVGAFLLVLGILAFAAEYVKLHRHDKQWCWRLANWLDSL